MINKFLSVVFVLKNRSADIERIASEACEKLPYYVNDFEIIIIDNASTDNSLDKYQKLTSVDGLPNIQVYALTSEVDIDVAVCVGLECALGDYVLVFNPFTDDINLIPDMLEKATAGYDVVFGFNDRKKKTAIIYSAARAIFNKIYKICSGLDLATDAPSFRLLNKKVINFILQHIDQAIAYKYLPATGGFRRKIIRFNFLNDESYDKGLINDINRGVKLLVTTTKLPMRFVTGLAMFGALSNLVYSIYIIFIAFYKSNIAPGWVSLSLQQSGMFFLISSVLFILGEYIINVSYLANRGPSYHIANEMLSARLTRNEKLNIEVVNAIEK
jgi:glycosyltransferase involved in cell wall biosynthesis